MNLLLLLSALMSALSGAIGGVRPGQARTEQVVVQRAVAARRVVARLRSWLVLADPHPQPVFAVPPAPLLPRLALYLAKRRE